jgi:hypothetical protein
MFAAFLLAISPMQSAVSSQQNPKPAAVAENSPYKLSYSEVVQLKAKAETGDADAQTTLGRAYQDGNGLTHDDGLAARWYLKAAEQGNASAQNSLGTMYRMGSGVEQDKAEAVNWYRKAARQQYAAAMFNLATAYYNGDGVGIDDVFALAWFLLAQKNGSQAANDAVTRMTAELTPSQVAEAYVKLADMRTKGGDIARDDKEAAAWYGKAADMGDAFSSVQLAQRLVNGLGVPQDYPTARRLCEFAANNRYGPGAYCLGLMNRDGLGGPKDLQEAVKWFGRAAEFHDDRAMLSLGEMYWKGEGVKPDKETAYMWFLIAANLNVQDASSDEQKLRQEMEAKAVEKARRKAAAWSKQHPQLALRQPHDK